MPAARKVVFSIGSRRTFASLSDGEATALVLQLDKVAERPAEAALPYMRVTELENLRVSFEVSDREVRVWSILRLS